MVHEALNRWAARGMRADNSSAIVVFIEKKKMEPKNGGTVEYTERWTSANKSELTKSFAKGGSTANTKKEQIKTEPAEVKPEVERKPLQEVKTERKSDIMGAKSTTHMNRKRNSTENNNENQSPASKRLRVPEPTSKPTRRRSTRIAVKRCEHGLTRSAARKRASL